MSSGAIRARNRREKEKAETEYNATLREYIHCRYENIMAEFEPFFKTLKAKYPEGRKYTNTKEFRLWRKRQIREQLQAEQQQQQNHDSEHEQQDENEQQQNHDSEHEQQDENEQQQNHGSEHEQQVRHEQQGPVENEQQQNHTSDHEQQVHHEYDSKQQQQLQVQEHEGHNRNEQQQQDHNDNVQEPPDEVAQALNEVEAIIQEIEHAGIPLNPLFEDEGIALDLYEEIHGDIDDFDFHLEVELGQ